MSTATLTGVDAFQAQVSANLATPDFSGTMSTVSDVLCQAHAGFFNSQAAPNGMPWAPIAKRTSESRLARDLGGGKIGDGKYGKPKMRPGKPGFLDLDHTILIDTGAMKSSVTFRGNSNHVENITPTSLDWGTRDPKAAIHQYGAFSEVYDEIEERTKEIEIPARPFVGWSDMAIDSAVQKVADDAVTMLLVGI